MRTKNRTRSRNLIALVVVGLPLTATPRRSNGATPAPKPQVSSLAAPPQSTNPVFAYSANNGDSTVSIYMVNEATGLLTAIGSTTLGSNTNPGSVALANTSAGTFLYVSDNGGNVSEFSVNTVTGSLTPLGNGSVAAGSFPAVLVVDPTNQFVYVANAGDNTLSAFRIGTNGTLNPIGTSTAGYSSNSSPISLTVVKGTSQNFVYAVTQNDNTVTQFTICAQGSNCSPVGGLVSGVTISTGGSHLQAVAATPNGQFLYVADKDAGNVLAYTINLNSGALSPTNPATFTTGTTGQGPFSIAIDPKGQYLYTANSLGNTISAFTINSDGSLTTIGSATDANGSGPATVLVDPSGQFLYVLDQFSGSNQEQTFAIAPAFSSPSAPAGSLTALSSTNTGSLPISLALTSPVNCPSIAIGQMALAIGAVGVPYTSATFSELGGNLPVLYSAESVSPGLMFSSIGVLTGTPTMAGTFSFTVTVTDTDGCSGSSASPFSLTIGKGTPVITWPPPASITAGTALSTTQLDASASIPGSFAYSPGLGAFLAAGPQTLTATFTPADSADYNSATATVALTVNPGTLPPVVINVTEAIHVTDTPTFPDVFDSESVHVTDQTFIVPLVGIGAPVVSYSTGSLGFGSVSTGQTATQALAVSNIGQGQTQLSLGSFVISNFAFNLSSVSCSNGATSFPITLPSGGACLLLISYAAPPGNPASGTITFADNSALSNLASLATGTSYTQAVVLSGSGTSAPSPPPPPATITIPTINETINVIDTVTVLTLQSIVVTPANPTVAVGLSQSFAATGRYSDGSTRDLTGVVTWTSANPAIASISGNSATGVANGSTTVTATIGSTSGSTTLQVLPPFIRIMAQLTSITQEATGNYHVAISFTNLGDIVTTRVSLLPADLGRALISGSSLPSLTNLAPGTTAMLNLVFPSSAGKPGSAVPLIVAGIATGQNPNGKTNTALWLLTPTTVTLP